MKTLCRKRVVPPADRLRSLPSMLQDDLQQFREHIGYCIQEPGDVVLFSPLTAHCVLTGPVPAALMTTTLKVEESEEEGLQYQGAQYQPQGVRGVVRVPGSRERSRGKRRSRILWVKIALKQNNIQNTSTHFFKSVPFDVNLTRTVLSQQTTSINLSTFWGIILKCIQNNIRDKPPALILRGANQQKVTRPTNIATKEFTVRERLRTYNYRVFQ